MSVRTINATHDRKSGRVAITFEVDPQTWRAMARSAQAGAHDSTLDYVAAQINMAFLDDEPPRDSGPGKPGDMDDDLPF